MNDLFTAFQNWIQGQINVCVDGLLARVTRLEEERTKISTAILDTEGQLLYFNELRIDDQITGLRMENDNLRAKITEQTINLDNLYQELRTLNVRMTDLEDRRGEGAPGQALENFQERVYECFDSEEFRDAVNDQVAEYIDNSDDVCTLGDVKDFIDSNVSVELSVSRW